MRNASSLLIVCHLLCLLPPAAMALGFGPVDGATILGQRLNLSTQLSVEPQDALTEACVSAEVRVGDSRLGPEQVRVALSGGPNATQKTLRITSTVVVDEPIVQLNLTVGCGSRVSRSYTVFADPPLLELARPDPPAPPLVVARTELGAPAGAAGPASERPPGAAVDAQAAPASATTSPDAATARRPEPAARPRAAVTTVRPTSAARVAATAEPRLPARARPPPPARAPAQPAPAAAAVARAVGPAAVSAPVRAVAGAASAAAASGPRLRLEADTALAGGPAAAASMPAAASSPSAIAASGSPSALVATSDAASAAAAGGTPVDDELRRLRGQNQDLQRSLGTVEARLRELESARGRDPWWMALAALAALLALIGVLLLWRRVQRGAARSWWNPSALAPADSAAALPTLAAAHSTFKASEIPDGVVDDDEEDFGAQSTGSFAMTLPGEPVSSEPQRGALSVEELFDLEQQADFFLALGQEDAAIDLLLGHARGNGATSPMPYLKLIDIYRRRDDREGYEATRQHFNQRFNARVASWDEPTFEGRALDETPPLLASIQAVWAQPAQAVRQLEGLVWRGDEPRAPVDLAAYRDLLFLYTVARDLLDQAGTELPADGVDLALPLLEGNTGSSHVARLMSSTIPIRPLDEHDQGLDRAIVPDIDLSEPSAQPLSAPAPAPAPRPDFTLGSDLLQLDPPPAEPRG